MRKRKRRGRIATPAAASLSSLLQGDFFFISLIILRRTASLLVTPGQVRCQSPRPRSYSIRLRITHTAVERDHRHANERCNVKHRNMRLIFFVYSVY
jgi:hypothetical protein